MDKEGKKMKFRAKTGKKVSGLGLKVHKATAVLESRQTLSP